jgi:hypothetical protein
MEEWHKVEEFIERVTGKKPQDAKGYLFLIGVQTLGKGAKNFTKEQKQDLLHIGLCEVFMSLDYYRFSHRDADGWPHYDLQDKIPHHKLFEQENLIKQQIIAYFKGQKLI